jgi:hypothetical protein
MTDQIFNEQGISGEQTDGELETVEQTEIQTDATQRQPETITPDNPQNISPQQEVQPADLEAQVKGKLAKALDWLLDKLTALGVPVLKYGGAGVSFASEILAVQGGWLAKLGLIGAGWGLEKIGSRHPGSRVSRLCKAFGSGVWRGGAFGLVSNLVVNSVLPLETGAVSDEKILPTQALAERISALDLSKVISAPGAAGQFVSDRAREVADFVGSQKAAFEVSPFGQQVSAGVTKAGQEASRIAGQAVAEIGPDAQQLGQTAQVVGQKIAETAQQAVSSPEAKLAAGAGLTAGIGGLLNKIGLFRGKSKQA